MPYGVIVLWGSCPRGSCPRGSCPRGSCPRGNCPKGSCPKGSCPRGSCPRGSCPVTKKVLPGKGDKMGQNVCRPDIPFIDVIQP